MTDRHRLAVHHIGGRAGSRAFPVLPTFEADVVNVLYEADPGAIEQMEQYARSLPSELRVLPYCIAGSSSRVRFLVNYDAYTSSLLPLNESQGTFYLHRDGVDHVLAESWRTVRELELDALTLDAAIAAAAAPPPDVLSVDTQGSELAILEGARTALDTTVAVVSEVEFRPLYAGQPLFGDVLDHLAIRGFEFVRFLKLGELAPRRAPLGARGDGFHAYADALFLRRPEVLADGAAIRKLIFVSTVFGQIEFALSCIDDHRAVIESTPVNASWSRFVDDLVDAYGRTPKSFPPTFGERFTLQQSEARWNPATTAPLSQPAARKLAAAVPGAHGAMALLRRGAESLRAERRRRRHRPGSIELLLRDSGLDDAADAVRTRDLRTGP